MDLEKLKKFVQFAKDSGVSELKYEAEDEKFSVTLPVGSYASQLVNIPQFNPLEGEKRHENLSDNRDNKDENLVEITSPFVGTFYRSPSPEAEAFVKPGDNVSHGKFCVLLRP